MAHEHGQMSESLLVGMLLALAGGFMDAYTYLIRDQVFANAQTGNIVLFGIHLMQGEWWEALHYFIPIVSFSVGVLLVLAIRAHMKDNRSLHWRQLVLVLEILFLFVVALLPQSMNVLANVLVSFICAMQVECFRKIRGVTCATTMCTGNLRSGTELLWQYRRSGDPDQKRRGLHYIVVDVVFIAGAMLGALVTRFAAEKAILAACALLCMAFVAMFIEKDIFSRTG